MSYLSAIEWTQSTWNPVTGCHKVSAACSNCYAERFANRFRGVKGHPYEQGFSVRMWPARLALPLRWARSRLVFVNSMSDLFLEEIPSSFIAKVFQTMASAPQHTFQVLTKRPGRMAEWLSSSHAPHPLPTNIWLGVSVENSQWLKRVDLLRSVKAAVRFISFEPLLGPIELRPADLRGIHWVIVGGETGPAARRMEACWVDSIYSACEAARVPFFFKQWGAYDRTGKRVGRSRAGRRYRRREWNEMPDPVRGGHQNPATRM